MNTLKIIILMGAFFAWLTGCKESSNNRGFEDDKFKAGQIWKYDTRTGEENSTIKILKVEKYDKSGIVIHIYVGGLKIKNPNKPSGFLDEIGHLPLSKEAVMNSVTSLVSEHNELTDYTDGYNNWKEAFESNKGGIFSTTIKRNCSVC